MSDSQGMWPRIKLTNGAMVYDIEAKAQARYHEAHDPTVEPLFQKIAVDVLVKDIAEGKAYADLGEARADFQKWRAKLAEKIDIDATIEVLDELFREIQEMEEKCRAPGCEGHDYMLYNGMLIMHTLRLRFAELRENDRGPIAKFSGPMQQGVARDVANWAVSMRDYRTITQPRCPVCQHDESACTTAKQNLKNRRDGKGVQGPLWCPF